MPAIQVDPAFVAEPSKTGRNARVFFYVVSMLGALAGGFFGVLGFVAASSAPHEGAAAAFGCLLAVAPYVVARSVERHDALTLGATPACGPSNAADGLQRLFVFAAVPRRQFEDIGRPASRRSSLRRHALV